MSCGSLRTNKKMRLYVSGTKLNNNLLQVNTRRRKLFIDVTRFSVAQTVTGGSIFYISLKTPFMKKCILFVSLFVLSVSLFAQNNISVGPVAGFGHTWISNVEGK